MEKIRRRKYMETIIQTQAAVIEELENRCSEKMAYIDKEALKLVSKIGILI